LRVFENRVLKRICEPKREEVTGGSRPRRINDRIILKWIDLETTG
jgi:hypothetical protein